MNNAYRFGRTTFFTTVPQSEFSAFYRFTLFERIPYIRPQSVKSSFKIGAGRVLQRQLHRLAGSGGLVDG